MKSARILHRFNAMAFLGISLLAMAFNQPAKASLLTLTNLNSLGLPDTNTVKSVAADTNTPTLADGTVTTIGLPVRWQPDSNGVVQIFQTAGNYVIYGPTLGRGMLYRFPDSSSNATAVALSGFNTFQTPTVIIDSGISTNISNATGTNVNLTGSFTGTVDYQNGNPAIGPSPLYLSVGANALYYPDGSPFAFATNSWVQMSWPSGFGAMNNTNGALVLPYLGVGQGGLATAFGTQILDAFGNFLTPLNATTLQGLSVTNFLLVTNNLTIAGGTNGIGNAAGGVGGIVNMANGGSSGYGIPGVGGTVNLATSGYNGGTVNIATSPYGTGGTVNLATTSGGTAGTVNAGNINAGNVAGTFIGNGSQLTGLTAAQIAGLPATNGLATTNYVTAATAGMVTNGQWPVFVASQFGVKFGTNDDSVAIQSLFDGATNRMGTTLLIDGVATVTKTMVMRSNTKLLGASRACGLFLATNVNDFLLTSVLDGNNYTTTNIALENLTLNCNGANQFMRNVITNTSPHFRTITNADGTLFTGVAPGTPVGFGIYNWAVWFNSYIGLTIRDVTIWDAPCFGLMLGGCCSNTVIENLETSWPPITYPHTYLNHDGIHILGDNFNGTVKNLTIKNNDDDWVGLSGGEWSASAMCDPNQGYYSVPWSNTIYSVYPGIGTNQGLIQNWSFENINVEGTNGAGIRILSISTNKNFYKNISFTGVHGTKWNTGYNPGIVYSGGTTRTLVDNLMFRDFYVEGNAFSSGAGCIGFDLFYIYGTNLLIENFNTSSEPTGMKDLPQCEAYVISATGWKNITIKNFNLNVPANAETNYLVYWDDSTADSTYKINISGMNVGDSAGKFRAAICTYNYYGTATLSGNIFPAQTFYLDTLGFSTNFIINYAPLPASQLTGTFTGNGSGLTNAAGNPYIDAVTATNIASAATNGLVGASITNGLASTNYVNAATSGMVTNGSLTLDTNVNYFLSQAGITDPKAVTGIYNLVTSLKNDNLFTALDDFEIYGDQFGPTNNKTFYGITRTVLNQNGDHLGMKLNGTNWISTPLRLPVVWGVGHTEIIIFDYQDPMLNYMNNGIYGINGVSSMYPLYSMLGGIEDTNTGAMTGFANASTMKQPFIEPICHTNGTGNATWNSSLEAVFSPFSCGGFDNRATDGLRIVARSTIQNTNMLYNNGLPMWPYYLGGSVNYTVSNYVSHLSVTNTLNAFLMGTNRDFQNRSTYPGGTFAAGSINNAFWGNAQGVRIQARFQFHTNFNQVQMDAFTKAYGYVIKSQQDKLLIVAGDSMANPADTYIPVLTNTLGEYSWKNGWGYIYQQRHPKENFIEYASPGTMPSSMFYSPNDAQGFPVQTVFGWSQFPTNFLNDMRLSGVPMFGLITHGRNQISTSSDLNTTRSQLDTIYGGWHQLGMFTAFVGTWSFNPFYYADMGVSSFFNSSSHLYNGSGLYTAYRNLGGTESFSYVSNSVNDVAWSTNGGTTWNSNSPATFQSATQPLILQGVPNANITASLIEMNYATNVMIAQTNWYQFCLNLKGDTNFDQMDFPIFVASTNNAKNFSWSGGHGDSPQGHTFNDQIVLRATTDRALIYSNPTNTAETWVEGGNVLPANDGSFMNLIQLTNNGTATGWKLK